MSRNADLQVNIEGNMRLCEVVDAYADHYIVKSRGKFYAIRCEDIAKGAEAGGGWNSHAIARRSLYLVYNVD